MYYVFSELYLDADIERESTCELEVDVVAADILNRLEVNGELRDINYRNR